MTPTSKRFAYLDSVRGIAALIVVFSHFSGVFELVLPNWLDSSVLHIFYDGFAAVSMFFVLSGFVLSVKFFSSSAQPQLRAFVIARFFRIYPPFFVTLIVSAILATLFFKVPNTTPEVSQWLIKFWRNDFDLGDFLRQARFASSDGYKYLPQGWTLGIELAVSCFIPFLVIVMHKGNDWLLVFVILLVGYFRATDFIVAFVLGMLLAKYHLHIQSIWKSFLLWKKIGILLIGLMTITIQFSIFPALLDASPQLRDSNLPDRLLWFSRGLGSFILIGVVLGSERAQRFLHLQPLEFIGKVSYSVYLWHFVILFMVAPQAMLVLNSIGLIHTSFTLPLVLIAVLACLCVVSTLSYHFIEKPFIKLGKKITAVFDSQLNPKGTGLSI